MPPAAKYKLHKVEAGGAKPKCAFYFSEKGCRTADNCKFSHEADTPANNEKPMITSSSSSVCSSESELDTPVNRLPPSSKKKKKEVKKLKDIEDDPCPFRTTETQNKKKRKVEKPTTTATTPPKQQQQQKETPKKKKTTPTPKPTVTPTPQSETATPKSKKRKTNPKTTPTASATASFRNLKLPISTFSCYKEENEADSKDTPPVENKNTPPVEKKKKQQKMKKEESDDSSSSEEEGEVVAKKAVPPPSKKYLVPNSTKEGLKWQKAVAASQANSRFPVSYDFDKYKTNDVEKKTGYPTDWVKAKEFGDWCKNNPHAIAIDCEMCKTRDPVTGAEDHKALCRLSVVNACDTSDVLIDTLVKPAWPVVDHRSWVNGIGEDHLQSVQFTLRHAQAFMLSLCSEETVIIGHSLENDLVALKMEHYTVADSALLFNVKDEDKNATPSLKDCAFNILQREMPDTHDSVNDATVTLKCIEEGWIEKKIKGEDVIDIPRTFSKKKRPNNKRDSGVFSSQDYASALFVHRIPTALSVEHISNLFVHLTSIQPKDVPAIDFGSDYGKTTVAFSSETHARLAFESLKGDAKPDKTGRFQKRVYLKKGGYIQVRKMLNSK